MMKLFDSHILPILDYGSEIWFTNKKIHNIEFVQLWFIKTTLGIKTQSSNLVSLGETGRFPLILRQQDFALKYFDRLIHFDKSRPLYKVYLEVREMHHKGYRNWYSKIDTILHDNDITSYSDKMLSKETEVESSYLHTKDKRYQNYLIDYFKQINDSVNKPLLRTHKKFKLESRCEPYLLISLQYKYRQAIARIRASSHHLGIETGRHKRPKPTPLAERNCVYCLADVLDDEFHFLLYCEKNSDERSKLYSKLPPHILDLDPEDLFIYLLNSNDDSHIRLFGKFVFDSFKARLPPENGLLRAGHNR